MTAPTLDGEVLSDPAWDGVQPTTGFIQRTPDQGEPATERTEVFIGTTKDTLYFGVVCYDREPDRIIVAHSVRDEQLDETDAFQIVLDTYRDQQTGFVFGTNPAGVEFDGQVGAEGGEGSFGGGTASRELNTNWNGVWEVRAAITDIGWSAEFAIPFRTLRYPGGRVQRWSLNMQRNIRRRAEESFWSPIPVQFDLLRLSMAGTLADLEVQKQRNLKITPYVLGEVIEGGVEGEERETRTDWGLDLKYSITPSLTLDVTYNTDFAQVEADEQQINLDRFTLFYPEKRPFFLENANYFFVGEDHWVEMFFSRRIGIGPDGEIIPIIAGVRASGKVAGRYNLGTLYMRTDAVEGVAPQNDFAVARFSRDLPNRSYIGGIVVGREGRGELATDDDHNYTVALDGQWGIGESVTIQWHLAQSETPGAQKGEYSYRVNGRYNTERWSATVNYTVIADDFNPEVGFLARTGIRNPDLNFFRRFRSPDLPWGLLEVRPGLNCTANFKLDGYTETGRCSARTSLEWRNSSALSLSFGYFQEGVLKPFEIYPGIDVPAGEYEGPETRIDFNTNQGAPASFQIETRFGGFFGGERMSLEPQFNYRRGEAFNVELGWSYNDIDLQEGAFTTNLGRLRLRYSFTPLIMLQALLQYNDRDDQFAANLRFSWLRTADSGLYVVYNEIQNLDRSSTDGPGRSLIVKYSYLFDVLK